ncbi:MAG TPA: hypothetical protein ENI85_05905 [Deltaproteobacteria bacterium]|nr:hypothetical protein [Deltaproteobacteria bacterium]
MKTPTLESDQTPFEVRCPRCDVTFPIGTKRCVHCGGRTVPSNRPRTLGRVETVGSAQDDGSSGLLEWDSGSGPDPMEFDGSDREIEMDDEPPSVARSLVRSLGGLVWVIALIVFSLARNCGDK